LHTSSFILKTFPPFLTIAFGTGQTLLHVPQPLQPNTAIKKIPHHLFGEESLGFAQAEGRISITMLWQGGKLAFESGIKEE
jgi:hypothetical protein